MWKHGKSFDMCKTLCISGILPAFFNTGENLETTKSPRTDNAKGHEGANPYSNFFFHGIPGYFSKQGEVWETIKNKANPVIKNIPNIMPNFNQLKYITKEFINKLEGLRDPKTHELMPQYREQFISFLTFLASNGLLRNQPDPMAVRITEHLKDFFSNKSVNENFKKSPEFQRFFENYNKNIKMTNTYIEASIKSFELVESDKNKWVLEQLRTFKKQVAGIVAIGMLIADKFTTAIRPQKCAEIDQIGENESIMNQLWKISKGAPALIAIFLLLLGADTTSFGFVSVIYHLLWYLSK